MNSSLPRLHVRRRVDDTESPVSAMLKLNPMQPGLVLFESVVGGETRGRYSFIGMSPDLWWRVKGGKASCVVNGTEVKTLEKAELVGADKLDALDGIYGIRVSHNLELTVSGLAKK
jgi:anthranilate/para-aminobenzoate synthase component I